MTRLAQSHLGSMDLIDPTHFDAIVVTSGLPEVLIASALAKAGKSVLVLDSADSYGASWASLNGPDYVHNLINRQLEHQALTTQQQLPHEQPAQLSASTQHQPTQQPQHGASVATSVPPGGVSVALQHVAQLGGVSGCSLYTHPEVEGALASKGLIIDLAPKVMYQDEGLVGLLVSCQAHNYLEFKLVEGSYMYVSGRLRQVPASRADLFADKSLTLPDKHSLGRFMAACMEAQQGCGRLKDAFGPTPLVDLLASEGLSEQLQEVVLCGIAMADVPQHPHEWQQQEVEQQQQQQQSRDAHSEAAAAEAGAQPGITNPTPSNRSRTTTTSSSSSSSSRRRSGLLSAAEGLAALQLYTTSLGRYGGKGAFMAPCYGCGSLPEAFVRLAAVKGAVTALRHGAHELQLLPRQQQDQQQEQRQQQQQEQSSHGAREDTSQGNASAAAGAAAGADVSNSSSIEASAAEATAADGAAGADAVAAATTAAALAAAAAAARVRVVLSTGQSLTTNVVISCKDGFKGSSTGGLSASISSSSGATAADAAATADAAAQATHQQVACVVAVLDGSVVDGDSSLLLVFPPGSLGSQQTAVIRGLQLGPALEVTPPGKYLLYLTAVLPSGSTCDNSSSSNSHAAGSTNRASSSSSSCILADQVLGPALQALVSTKGLVAFRFSEDEQEIDGRQHGINSAAASPDAAAAAAAGIGAASVVPSSSEGQAEQQQQQQQSFAAASLLPQVLAVCYFTTQQSSQQFFTQQQLEEQQGWRQQQQQQAGTGTSGAASDADGNTVLWCPAAPHGLMGYSDVVQATEAAFRQQFPGLPWLSDELPAAGQPAAAGAAAADGSGGEGEGSSTAAEGHAAGAGAGAAGVLDDGELDAIDELTAALMELAAPAGAAVEPK